MEELEVIEIDEEIEIDGGDTELEDLPLVPQTQMEEENYEIGDTNI